MSVSIKVMKTWSNAWSTSHRYHEGKILPCMFGCHGCKDTLNHYLQCPHLFALWRYLVEGTNEMPLIRWGLIHPDKHTFHSIACVFSGYHAIRHEFRSAQSFFEFNQQVLTTAQLRRAWTVFAEAFKVEARELALQSRQFLVCEFLHSIT